MSVDLNIKSMTTSVAIAALVLAECENEDAKRLAYESLPSISNSKKLARWFTK